MLALRARVLQLPAQELEPRQAVPPPNNTPQSPVVPVPRNEPIEPSGPDDATDRNLPAAVNPDVNVDNPRRLSLGEDGQPRITPPREPQPPTTQDQTPVGGQPVVTVIKGPDGRPLVQIRKPPTTATSNSQDSVDATTAGPLAIRPNTPQQSRGQPLGTLRPMVPESPFPVPDWLSPKPIENPLPSPQTLGRASQKPSDFGTDATSVLRLDNTPGPGQQTHLGLRNVKSYNDPVTGNLVGIPEGFEANLTIPSNMSIHIDHVGNLIVNDLATGVARPLHELAKKYPGKVYIAVQPDEVTLKAARAVLQANSAAALAPRSVIGKSVVTSMLQGQVKLGVLGSLRLRLNITDSVKAMNELSKVKMEQWMALFNGESAPEAQEALKHLLDKGAEVKISAASLPDVPPVQEVVRGDDILEMPVPDMIKSRFFVSPQSNTSSPQLQLPQGNEPLRMPKPSDFSLMRFNGRLVPGTNTYEYLGEKITFTLKRTGGLNLAKPKVFPAKGVAEMQYQVTLKPGDLLPANFVQKLERQLTDTGTYSIEMKDRKAYAQLNFRNDYARISPSRTGMADINWLDWLVPKQAQADQPKKMVFIGPGSLFGQDAGALFAVDPKMLNNTENFSPGNFLAQRLWNLAELGQVIPRRRSHEGQTQALNQMMVELPRTGPGNLQTQYAPLVKVTLEVMPDGSMQTELEGLQDSTQSNLPLGELALLSIRVKKPAGSNAPEPKPVFAWMPRGVVGMLSGEPVSPAMRQSAIDWLQNNLPTERDWDRGIQVPRPASQNLLDQLTRMARQGGDNNPFVLSPELRRELTRLLFGRQSNEQ